MAEVLSDGTVIPSHMGYNFGNSGTRAAYANTQLRVGYLIATHYPKDKGYENNHDTLYDAICMQGEGGGSDVYVTYRNCKLANLFGNGKDWEKRSLRCPTSFTGTLNNDFFKSTTRVLILCVNGRSNSPYIIAADTSPDSPSSLKEDGHAWGWNFNGINWLIDKDGQLALTFNGKTVDGNNQVVDADPNVAGSYLKFDKEGNIVLDDAAGEVVKIDKKNKKIVIEARQIEQKVTDKGWTVEVAGDVKIHSQKNATISADVNTYIGSTGAAEPLVLGNQLAAALGQLVSLFVSAPIIGAAGQVPVVMDPGLKAGLIQWAAQYGVPTAPILSKSKFTE